MAVEIEITYDDGSVASWVKDDNDACVEQVLGTPDSHRL
jgi:hypothetical protein